MDVQEKSGDAVRDLVVMLAGAVVAAGLAFWGARTWLAGEPMFERRAVVGDCDLRSGPCHHDLSPGRQVSLSILPSALPLMQPLQLEVRLGGAEADAVRVDVRGLNMDMGLNLTRLQRVAPGTWRGETILPICSQRRMEWEAAVQVDAGSRVEIPFPFFTERP